MQLLDVVYRAESYAMEETLKRYSTEFISALDYFGQCLKFSFEQDSEQNDTKGANKVFRHGMFLLICVSAILSFTGVFFTDVICALFGAGKTFHELAAGYLFWYLIFIIPSGISYALQNYCRNDGAPGLVSAVVIVTTVCNIFGDWLLIFHFRMGTKGAAIATGISQSFGFLSCFCRKYLAKR